MKPKKDGNENTITETKNDSIKSQCENIIKTKNEFYVYALIDPDTHLPFYIGKGKGNRDTSHIRETKRGNVPHGNKHLYYKIKSIIGSDKTILVERLETNITESAALAKETEYIRKYGRRDTGTGILTNLTDGGEGQSGWVPTEEYRNKMSKSTSGNKNGMFGKSQTEETKEKIKNKAIGRLHSSETKDNLSKLRMGKNNSFFGMKHSEKTKQVIRAKSVKRGKENGCYVELDHIKKKIVDVYLKSKNVSEVVRWVNSNGTKCSRIAIKRRLMEWNVVDKNKWKV